MINQTRALCKNPNIKLFFLEIAERKVASGFQLCMCILSRQIERPYAPDRYTFRMIAEEQKTSEDMRYIRLKQQNNVNFKITIQEREGSHGV